MRGFKLFVLVLFFPFLFSCTSPSKSPDFIPEFPIPSEEEAWAVYPNFDEAESFESGVARVKLGEKWGLIDTLGRVVAPFRYDKISSFYNGFAVVENDHKRGLVDSVGREVVPLVYESYVWSCCNILSTKGIYDFLLNDQRHLYFPDPQRAKMVKLPYDDVDIFATEGLTIASIQGKMGFIDKLGEVIIPLQYDSVGFFSKKYAMVKLNDKFGLIDKVGNIVCPIEYESYIFLSKNFEIKYFLNGLMSLQKDGKWGCVNPSHEIIIPFEYDDYLFFKNGISLVAKKGKHGIIDTLNQVVLPLEYDSIFRFFNGLMIVEKDKKWGVYDDQGRKFLFEPQFSEIRTSEFSENEGDVMALRRGQKWGIYDLESKKMTFNPQFDSIIWFNDSYINVDLTLETNMIVVKTEELWGVIDSKGKEIISPDFDEIYFFSDQLIFIKKNDLNGIFNREGEQITPFKYTRVTYGGDDFLVGEYDESSIEIVNALKKEIYPINGVSSFRMLADHKLIKISQGFKKGLINEKGEFLCPIQYSRIGEFWQGLAAVNLKNKWGYINLKGEEVVLPTYQDAKRFAQGLAPVKIHGKWGYIKKPTL